MCEWSKIAGLMQMDLHRTGLSWEESLYLHYSLCVKSVMCFTGEMPEKLTWRHGHDWAARHSLTNTSLHLTLQPRKSSRHLLWMSLTYLGLTCWRKCYEFIEFILNIFTPHWWLFTLFSPKSNKHSAGWGVISLCLQKCTRICWELHENRKQSS